MAEEVFVLTYIDYCISFWYLCVCESGCCPEFNQITQKIKGLKVWVEKKKQKNNTNPSQVQVHINVLQIFKRNI